MLRDADLEAYFARVGASGAARADRATLAALHARHTAHIPFENLDIQAGLPVALELEALADKLVHRRRGGYCFEHNTLFLAVLRRLGFDAVPFEARVRLGAAGILPRTHMVLGVRLAGVEFVADVGFGGHGLLAPVPMDGAAHALHGDVLRVVADASPEADATARVLQRRAADAWQDLYSFVPEARHAIDFELANHFTSTHPQSAFVRNLTVQLATPEARHVLRNRTYTVTRGPTSEVRELGDADLMTLVRERFGLVLPPEIQARVLRALPA